MDLMRHKIPLKAIVFVLFIGGLIVKYHNAECQTIANLQGKVLDQKTGLPIPDTHVFILASSLQTTTDETGQFRFQNLPSGSYNLQVTHVGFRKKEVSGIIVHTESFSTIEIRLSPEYVELPDVLVHKQSLPSAGALSGGKIIPHEQLINTDASDLGGALVREGLVSLTSDGAPGSRQTVSLRGSASNQVLILVDGHPLNTAADGTADLSSVSLSEIQQVEVYNHAPAGLGTQSIGGVINIVTIKPGIERHSLRFGMSEYGEKTAAVTIREKLKGFPFIALFDHQESSGKYRYRIIPEDGIELFTRNVGETFYRERSEYRKDFVAMKLDPEGILSFGYRRSDLYRQNPDYLPEPVLEHQSWTEDTRQEFYINVEGGSAWYHPRMGLKIEGYEQSSVTDYGQTYPALYNHNEVRGEVYSFQADWRRSHPIWEEIAIGTGVRWERIWSGELVAGYADRLHEYGFLQVQGNPFEAVNLPFKMGIFSGVRADLYRDEQVYVYPRLGVEFSRGVDIQWLIRGELAGAYRLPDFNSLFWKEDLQSEGNPNLKPEKSYNREIMGRIKWNNFTVSTTYFDRDIRNLIYWRLNFDDRWKPLNIARSWINGAEMRFEGISWEGDFGSRLTFSYQWMNAINLSGEANTDGMTLIYRPEQTGTLSINQNLRYFNVDISSRWVSERYTTEANTKSLSPYNVWDLGLYKHIRLSTNGSRITLRTQVNNLFDEDYRIVESAPIPLREIRFSVTVEYP
jgi:outer membrane receptor protein involved in Fe transport